MTSEELHERRRAIVRAFSEDPVTRWDHFAPGFRWRMIGTTPVSGLMIGTEGVAQKMAPFGERVASLRVIVDDVFGEGDRFVKIAHSEGMTVDGQAYRNEYATVFHFEGDKVVGAVEYLDTALIGRLVRGEALDSPDRLEA
jgi:ketosteroid isomerase-like protein